ncbi:unnamed protein product [Echinostoma caproni]|uniref:FAT domain-containing protein n=1 Tax=Echinostoma caproni TaxID=27848 RepID=A0A183AS43_9TREM|nr:unnamed protein product [Echinostoma caproni]
MPLQFKKCVLQSPGDLVVGIPKIHQSSFIRLTPWDSCLKLATSIFPMEIGLNVASRQCSTGYATLQITPTGPINRYLCCTTGRTLVEPALLSHKSLIGCHQFAFITMLKRMSTKIAQLLQSNRHPVVEPLTFVSVVLPVLHQLVDCTSYLPNGFNRFCENESAPGSSFHMLSRSMEPFVTATLHLIRSLLSTTDPRVGDSIGETDDEKTFMERVRLAGLVRLIHLQAAHYALDLGSVQQAEDWITDASCMPGPETSSNVSSVPVVAECWYQLRTSELSAIVERARGENRLATSHLQIALQDTVKVFATIPTSCSASLSLGLARCYLHGVTILCDWLFESRIKSAADLLTNYLEPAIQLAKRLSISVDCSAWASLARFADAQFIALDSYLSSSEFAARRQLLIEARRDVACLTDLGEKSRLLRMLQRQSAIESEEMETIQSDADRYLHLAFDSYSRCLSDSDMYDLKIYRFVSLWLCASADPDQQLQPNSRAVSVNRIMTERLPGIRSDKFLNLVPQLAVRLSSLYPASESSFQAILTNVIERLINDHPHHTAFVLLFLVNAKLDNVYNPRPPGQTTVPNTSRTAASRARLPRSSGKHVNRTDDAQMNSEENGRILAAHRLFERLSHGKRSKLLQQMQFLAEAYVEWANADAEKYRTHSGTRDCLLNRLFDLQIWLQVVYFVWLLISSQYLNGKARVVDAFLCRDIPTIFDYHHTLQSNMSEAHSVSNIETVFLHYLDDQINPMIEQQ